MNLGKHHCRRLIALHVAAVAALCAAAPVSANTGQDDPGQDEAVKSDATLVGHYYLSGVMETGSELLLKADGRFDWYISYGAVDQVAKGKWTRSGDKVTLVADLPSAGDPLFRVDERVAWNEDAERHLREQGLDRARQAAAALCPWNVAATMSAPMILSDDRPPPGVAQVAAARQAVASAELARDAASRAAEAAVGSSAGEAEREAAQAAMSDWYTALQVMEEAHREANLDVPDIGAPITPSQCQPPREDNWAAIPEAQWQRGIAIVVGDPARELRLSRVGTVFVYSDGHRETTQTTRGGWAFAPLRNGAAVEQVMLSLPEPVNRTQTLLIAPMAEGIQAILVDTRQLEQPPFEVMNLDIRDGQLIPDMMPRGRYSRQ